LKLRQEQNKMNDDGQKIVIRGICRPDGAGPLAVARATKMPLLTELNNAMLRYGINDIRLFYENDVRFLKQF
jgi:hypothetical protein